MVMYRTFILNFQGVAYLGYAALEVAIYPMMISGCLNQSRSLFEKFEEVLFGAAPEAIVEESHRKIKTLLCSEEARRRYVLSMTWKR